MMECEDYSKWWWPPLSDNFRIAVRCLVPLLAVLTCAHAQPSAESVKEQFAKRAARLWSLQPVTKPAVPTGVTAPTNPIDAFIAADYKDKGLLPAAKTDTLTLLRRVYLDLIGLPPAPAEQEAFLADTAPDAYEKVVDRLLDNEQHGVCSTATSSFTWISDSSCCLTSSDRIHSVGSAEIRLCRILEFEVERKLNPSGASAGDRL
jgi:hypothetical protein